MTPINDFIVINTIDHSKFNEDYKIVQTISTDEYAQSPYQEWKIYTDNKLFKTCKPGFHFQRIEKEGWKLLQEYSSPDNQFELATVLGQDKSGAWMVYGNKIGRQLIPCNQQKTNGIQRGDELLLRKFPTIKDYVVVHNINQAELIYKKQKYGPKYIPQQHTK